MLEAIRDRAQGWIAKVILGILIVPFALWGIDSYFSGSGQEKPAATVNGEDISQREFLKALRDQQDALGGKVEEKALRESVMEQLVNTRLLMQAAQKVGYVVYDAQIDAILQSVEIFQENGKFSPARLQAWLAGRNMNEAELRDMLRQDQLLRQIQMGLAEGAVVSRTGAGQLAATLGQQREVNELAFRVGQFAAAANIDDAAVAAEYKVRQSDFATSQQVRVQYVVFSQSALESNVTPNDEAARKYYEANAAKYQEPEQRRASHILIAAPEGDAKARQAAQAKAQQILAELQKTPARFADLAKTHSADPGSAARGGDLGAFTRDRMVKPFADAVWAMKAGEIRGLVETQFGFHIIRLDGVIPGAKLGFEVVKGDILQTLRGQEAQRRFAELAERFNNMVYEQPDNLEPVIKAFNLKLEESGWISERDAMPALLNNSRLLQSLFASDSLKNKQNVEAVEVVPGTLVAARVIEHRAAGVRPLAEVAAEIRAKLVQASASKLAAAAGEQALSQAKAGQAVSGWSAPMPLSRMQPLNLPREAVQAIFRAPVAQLPAYVGVAVADGYRVYRINRVGAVPNPPPVEAIRNDLRRLTSQEEVRAYLESLKADAKIEIDPASKESSVTQ